MGYELREHTADVAVAATGETLGAGFGAAADGMAAAMAATWPETGGERREIAVTAESREALLFDYLDRLIYERDIRSVLPVDNTGRVERPADDPESGTDEGGWAFTGTYRGVPLAAVDARDLKAVTYAEMTVERQDDGWQVYVVFDV
jgi:SHS2 domain-containing protein